MHYGHSLLTRRLLQLRASARASAAAAAAAAAAAPLLPPPLRVVTTASATHHMCAGASLPFPLGRPAAGGCLSQRWWGAGVRADGAWPLAYPQVQSRVQFLCSCILVFLCSCILVFLYSCILVFLYSCIPIFPTFTYVGPPPNPNPP
jgi:hypothetical protein